MQEYCCNFECISKDCCVDDCSEIQCQFQYDCEFCQHYGECQEKHEELVGEDNESKN
jgi:hypothetical protein